MDGSYKGNKYAHGNPNAPKVTCQIYNKSSHSTNKCFKLIDALLGQTQNASTFTVNTHTPTSILWLLNSGAMHHLTSNDNNNK